MASLRLREISYSVIGLERYFDVVIVSGEAGVAKPDRRVFELALRKLGGEPSTAWYVGDNIVNDVGGAQSAGWTAVWVNRLGRTRLPEHAEPHHEITSLTELLTILG